MVEYRECLNPGTGCRAWSLVSTSGHNFHLEAFTHAAPSPALFKQVKLLIAPALIPIQYLFAAEDLLLCKGISSSAAHGLGGKGLQVTQNTSISVVVLMDVIFVVGRWWLDLMIFFSSLNDPTSTLHGTKNDLCPKVCFLRKFLPTVPYSMIWASSSSTIDLVLKRMWCNVVLVVVDWWLDVMLLRVFFQSMLLNGRFA